MGPHHEHVPAVDILTLTPNPALDITTSIDRILPTHKMRCGPARYDPGGGGINVARVGHALGARTRAVFPVGGPTGEKLVMLLSAEGVDHVRIPIAGSTRESFTVDEEQTRLQYRFVLPGPTLTDAEQKACLDQLRVHAATARFVVLSGSLPPGTTPDFCQRVADVCAETGTPFILDTSGIGLRQVRSGVFLIKPSVRELAEYIGADLPTERERATAATYLISRGLAQHVLVSMGSEGALLVSANQTLRFQTPRVQGHSSVGAGDAMVAGVTTGLVRGWPLSKAVRLGTAAGAAMLLTPGTAVCTQDEVDRLLTAVPEPRPLDGVPSGTS